MTATQVRRIDEVAVVFNGKTPSKSEQRGSGHPVLKIKDVDALGRFRGTFSGHVGAELAQKHVKQQLAGGETLVLNAAHSDTHVASKTFYADQEVAGSLATGEWLIVRWRTDTVDSRFGNNWINTPDTRFRIRRLVNGIHLYPKDVARLQIPLPPLAEQKRIAAILDAADALRAKRREALAQLDTLLQSTFLDMFGDPVTNPMRWEERHLPDLVSKRKHALMRGPFGGALKKEIFVPEGFKVYEQKNVIYDDFDIGSYFIKKSDYERLAPFKINSNNLLVSCSGTIGSIAAVPMHAAPGVMNQALLKIDLDESIVLNSFFLSLWRSQSFEQQVLGMTHGTGMKNMKSMNELKGINFLVPPLDFQHRFAAIVKSVEHQKASQRAHLAELDTLFGSLQSRAFRGDL